MPLIQSKMVELEFGTVGRILGVARVIKWGRRTAFDERILFCVSDSGIGMRAQVLATLFESFSQGDSSTTRRYGGSGLGLAISKELVEMMQGQIRVQSAPGQGSRFSFLIPARMVVVK